VFIQNVFEFDIAARNSVSDYDKIGPRFQVLHSKRLADCNAKGF